jgi:hypothetical protein
MANNPELLKMPLARDGQKSTIPETTDASTGLFSQQYGWQSINSLPPQAGGKAVKREDFNGAFNLLGGIAYYAQKGFTFKWSADQDYYAGCVVIDDTDGLRYECIADVTANNTAPSADATHWQIFNSGGSDIDAWFRQPNTQYGNGAIALLLTLPTGWYLECTGTGGTTSASDLVITSPAVGNTVTDGTVVWTIRQVASTADIPAPVDISSKANVDLDNLSAAGEQKIQSVSPRYLTDSYYDATTGDWYRVYSDGWVEQGGLKSVRYDSSATLTFLKPMSDTKYTIMLTPGPAGFANQTTFEVVPLTNRTTTATKIGTYGGQNSGDVVIDWQIVGMGANN